LVTRGKLIKGTCRGEKNNKTHSKLKGNREDENMMRERKEAHLNTKLFDCRIKLRRKKKILFL
jgi:hypothetical protein